MALVNLSWVLIGTICFMHLESWTFVVPRPQSVGEFWKQSETIGHVVRMGEIVYYSASILGFCIVQSNGADDHVAKESLWFCWETLMTIGLGDLVPHTEAGRPLAKGFWLVHLVARSIS